MFRSFADKLSDKMMWCVVGAGTLLILAAAYLMASYATVVWKADEVEAKIGNVQITAKVNYFEKQIDAYYSLLTQEQTALKNVSQQLQKLAQRIKELENPKTANSLPIKINSLTAYQYLQEKMITTTPDLTETITNLKNQSDQIDEQKKNLDALKDELTQFKKELRKDPDTHPTQHNKK